MSKKAFVYLGLFIGSIIGGYIPSFFHADLFSGWSILGSTIGGLLGIFLGLRFGE